MKYKKVLNPTTGKLDMVQDLSGVLELEGLTIENNTGKIFNVKRTAVFDFVGTYMSAVPSAPSVIGWNDWTLEAGRTKGTVTGDVLNIIGDYFAIGKVDKFTSIYFDIATARSATGTFTWEYWNGVTWALLTCVDGTNALLTDGVVTFEAPADWVTTTQNGSAELYFVRLRPDTLTFSTEPTLYLCVPGDGTVIAEIYANGNDATPIFRIDAQGNIFLGNTITGINSNGPIVGNGALTGITSGAFSAVITATFTTTGYAHVPSFHSAGPAATALIPSQNSPVKRFTSGGWNGFVSKINAMDIYLNPDSEPITQSRLAFKNTTENGYAEASELANLDNDGRFSILGRAQSSYETFDSVQQLVTAVYTDVTLAAQTLNLITGDVLNAVGDYLYIGKRDKFGNIFFDFDTIMSAGTNRSWEYWNGSTWVALTVTDGTNQWQQDGNVSFTPPADWAKTTINSVGPIHFMRVGTVSGTFTVEPTLRFCLPAARVEVLSNGEMDTATNWAVSGDWAYSTLDHTFTFATGSGTLRQLAANFATPAKPKTWYRFRCALGVAGPATTLAWIGEEFAAGKTYFRADSTTAEVDVFFKTNDNPGDFVLYTTATALSGLRIDAVELMELTGGELEVTGPIKGKKITATGLIEYADNAAAIAAGLTAGEFYRTGDILKVVHA